MIFAGDSHLVLAFVGVSGSQISLVEKKYRWIFLGGF